MESIPQFFNKINNDIREAQNIQKVKLCEKRARYFVKKEINNNPLISKEFKKDAKIKLENTQSYAKKRMLDLKKR